MLTILHVAYALAPVGPAGVGGAEQVLTLLDEALTAAGHRSIVVAMEGSRTAGTLLPVPQPAGTLDENAIAAARSRHAAAVAEALRRHPEIDLVHMHGIDFHATLPPLGPPALVTLHAPFDWYPPEALRPRRPRTHLHCVSAHQHAQAPPGLALLPPIPNGVPIDALQARHAKRDFALMLGRVAPEKGVHLALDAAHRADATLLIAGEVFSYAEHERYFREEVAPRLDARRRFVGPADFHRKRRLLSAARCLLVPSQVPETSSLVAREALACGTPVIATPIGALPEIVIDGETGFLAADAATMAGAIGRAGAIDPEACRAFARREFDAGRMVARYLDAYAALIDAAPERGAA